jgi:immunoglobulin-like protein involved in spore germination
VDHEQTGTIVAYQANPSDQGHRRLFPVTVPVTLFPSIPSPTPAIVVEAPIENARVASPVLVSGTADVFEGTVSIRVLDENGAILSEDFTTATCGSGCLGTYRTRVRFRIDHKQRGSIQVFESSAENGEPLHMVEIPVTLLP